MADPAVIDTGAQPETRSITLAASHAKRRNALSGKAGAIVSEIEHRLTTGRYRFAEELSSAALVEEFDASRQPVSAAISHLRARGYVEVIPQVGCRFVSPGATEIADMFLGLGKIEGLIAALAAERQAAGEAELLLRVAEQNRFTKVNDPFEREQYIACIDDFHEQLMLMARSKSICDAGASWSRLSKFYLWQGSPKVQPSVAEKLNAERMEIARAVADGQSARATQLMDAHIVQKPYLAGIIN